MKIFGNSLPKAREGQGGTALASREEEEELARPSLEEALAWEDDFSQEAAEEWAAAVFGQISGSAPPPRQDREEAPEPEPEADRVPVAVAAGPAPAAERTESAEAAPAEPAPPSGWYVPAALRDTAPRDPALEEARRARRHALTAEELDRQAMEMEHAKGRRGRATLRSSRGVHVGDYSGRQAQRKKSHFGRGLLIYAAIVLVLTGFGLTRLWRFLDIYERSLPHKAIEAMVENRDSGSWRQLLSQKGVEDSFLDTLNLDQVGYYKKLELYTDAQPVYGIRFGGKTMLTVTMTPGERLDSSHRVWDVGTVDLIPSGLTVYVPDGAVITVDGAVVGEDRLTRRNAQPLTLGPFEAGREDAAGLSMYTLDDVYGIDNLTVTDSHGNLLELSYSRKNAYYYAPLTSTYTISAPSAAQISVNGIPLTEENARIVRRSLEDFEGLEGYVTNIPEYYTYTVEDLVVRPTVAAVLSDGTALRPTRETERRWEFDLENDPGFMAEQEGYILQVLDAYMAYSGNRGSDVLGNYARYSAYLYPGSEAADRASRARESIVWVGNRNTYPESVTIEEVIRYGANCYTALLDFTVAGDAEGEANTYLIIFYRSSEVDQWRVIRIMNKSAFL